MEKKKTYSVKEMAKVLGIGLNLAYEMVSSNQVPNIRVGNRYVIPVKALDEWLLKSCL